MTLTPYKKIFFVLLPLLYCTINFGQTLSLSKNARVSVLTCGTGNESYSLFGHTAIRIADPENFIDRVYNYGAFDFNTPNFVLKFSKGDLQYFAVSHSFTDFINTYTYERRSVYEQELNLPDNLKQKLFDNLNYSLASGDSQYTYKFIDKNCTSMVVDIINKTIGTTAIVKNTDTDISYRTILYPYFEHHFYEKLGTSIIFGKKVDQLGTKIFLPFELKKSLETTRFGGHLLARESKTLLHFNPVVPSSWWNNYYTYLLFLGLILLLNKTVLNRFYFIAMGILGLFFVFAGFYSLHLELEYNYNILLFNPILVAVAYFDCKKSSKRTYQSSLATISLLLLYTIIVCTKAHFLIVLPLIITNGILLVQLAIRNKKKIPVII